MFTAFGLEATSFAICTSKKKRNADVTEWAKEPLLSFYWGLQDFSPCWKAVAVTLILYFYV
jgi:hypothetical protein